MCAMNIPVLVVGKNIGGVLYNNEHYNFHITSNTNSDISNSLGLKNDIEKIRSNKQEIEKNKLTFDKNE
jgi:hypothetical protein